MGGGAAEEMPPLRSGAEGRLNVWLLDGGRGRRGTEDGGVEGEAGERV